MECWIGTRKSLGITFTPIDQQQLSGGSYVDGSTTNLRPTTGRVRGRLLVAALVFSALALGFSGLSVGVAQQPAAASEDATIGEPTCPEDGSGLGTFTLTITNTSSADQRYVIALRRTDIPNPLYREVSVPSGETTVHKVVGIHDGVVIAGVSLGQQAIGPPSVLAFNCALPVHRSLSVPPEPPVVTPTVPMIAPVAPASRPPAGETLLNAPIDGMESLGFGSSQSTVEAVLESQFPGLEEVSGSNWEDVAIVSDPSGDYLRTRSNVGDASRKQWTAPIPTSAESYLVYRFFLEPGFDAGDGNGSDGSPVWGTGVKMPGLLRGETAGNTGGNHSADGFSGRLMIRGTRKSDGETSSSREGLSLTAYIYGQEIDGKNIGSGFGEDYYLLDGFDARPFEGLNAGKHEGVGDPRIWDLEVGRWVTVILGYNVDGDNGWFKAWTMTDGIDTAPVPRLHIPRVKWMDEGADQGADALLFQQFWGGSGSVWYPDSVSYMRFKDFAVYTNEADALSAVQ